MNTTTQKMNLKEKILQVLTIKNLTFADLASYLTLSEAELDIVLKNNTIDIRTLEHISKELNIPLYSLFRENYEGFDFEKEPYDKVKSWNKAEAKYTPEVKAWRHELDELRAEVVKKNLLIDALEAQIIKK
jgi:transcriptional regulator with XRE-family HTH domain